MSLGARIPVVAVATFLMFSTLMFAAARLCADPIVHPHVQDEIIIKFKATTTQTERTAILGDLGATKLKDLKRMGAASHRLHGLTVEQAVQRYKNSSKIEYIEPNYIRQLHEIPNDPQFSALWGLRNTGQTGGSPDADIDAEVAWDVFTGSEGVVVGIIDTGADYNHPDLAANIYTNPGEIAGNGVDDDGNGYIDDVRGWDFANNDNNPMDDHGHGTHTAGTVGAVGDNGIGVVGVNWRVKIMPLKAFNAGGGASDVDLIEAIQYSTLMGVRLTSNSWGGGPFSAAMMQAIAAANAAGILFVAAAGNESSDNDAFPHYPSGYDLPNVVSVAATDHNDALAGFSSYGATTVDLGAPGVNILSTVPGGYGQASGTSMATPHVSGVLALIFGRFPGIGAPQAKALLLVRTDPVSGLAGRVLTGGRLNAFGAIAEPDSTPPDAVSDLSVGQPGSNWLVLHWTATGDDGTTGTASGYDLRYATFPITAENFATATPASNEPDPGAPGTAEEVQVRGLAFDTTYYFAVKVLDEFGNASEISNGTAGTTLGPPEIDVQPTALAEALLTGASSTRTLSLHNIGQGTLDFVIPSPSLVGAPTTIQQSLALGKGEIDPRAGAPVVANFGGPDGFGYRWVDSDEPGGPSFAWADISASGSVALSSGDDVVAGPFPIGFSFRFYGGEFTEFFVTSNGIVSLSSGDASFGNQPLPSPGAPPHLIAPFWDDLILSPGTVYWQNDGSRLIVQWQSVQHYGSGGPYTFQAILHPNGSILYQYLTMGEPRTSATIGIQNGTGTDGLQVVFNAPYVHDNLAVRIASVPQWVTVVPANGTVVAPGSTGLEVAIDATSLIGGTYEAEIHVLSNDTDEADFVVPVHLQVTGAPDIVVSASALDFGSPYIGALVTRDLVVSNPGTDVLHVSGVAADHGDFSVDVSSFDLAPFGNRTLHVTFAPSSPALIHSTLTLTSDDPDEAQVSVSLQGEGILPPDIAVSPASLNADLLTGQSATRTLTIANQGVTDLDFQLGFEFLSATASATAAPKTPAGAAHLAATGSNGGAAAPRLATELVRQEKRPGPAPERRNFAASPAPDVAAEFRTYGLTAERVLVYADDYRHSAGSHYIDQALQGLGLSYTAYYNDPSGFESALASGSWDLVIVDNYTFVLGEVWDDIDAHIAAGGKALITTWNLDGVSAAPLWAHLGLQWVGDLFSPQPVFRWNPGHPLFTHPESVPDFTQLSDFYTDDGDRVNAIGSAQLVAGFTAAPASGQGALLVAASRHAIVNTFMPVENTSDRDADGKLDGVELFTNEVASLTIPSWLSAEVESGTVPPGGSVDVQITFDASELFGGDYEGRIVVTSNDPDEAEVGVPAHLHVTGVEDIDVQPLALDFGNVFLGYHRQLTLTVSNTGTDALTVSGTLVGLADYQLSASTYVLQPRASTTITVTFAPTLAAVRNTQLGFFSSDPDEPLVIVDLAGTGLVPPVAGLLPASLSANLLSGASETQFVTLSNSGGSELQFTTGPELASSPSVVYEHIELGKGEPDPRLGAPVLQDAGGPDAFGYRWTDSDHPAGPGFQWLDVRSTGTAVFSSPVDDSNMGPFPIGFGFSYYGTTYTEFRVCSNGFISFTSPSAQFSNQPLPSTSAPENMLAAFWSDLYVDPANGNVYYHSDGNRLVVQFEHIWHLGGDGPYSFEIVLYPDGSIVYQYLSVGDGFPFNTVGFQNAARNDGLSIGFNTDYVHDNLAVRIAALPPWLRIAPPSGVVPAGGSVQLAATFDATGLLGGGYDGRLVVRSNDPAHPEIRAGAHLQVTGVPDIAVGTSSLDFGSTFLGTQVSRDLVVSNPGTDILHVTGAAANHSDFSVDVSSFDLGPFGSRTLHLTFAPSTPALIQATLTLTSNDPDEAQLSVVLQGQGLVPPDIAVSPASLSADLLTGQTATRTLTISNQGANPLEYQIGFEYLSAPAAATAVAAASGNPSSGTPALPALAGLQGKTATVPVLPGLQGETNTPEGAVRSAAFRTYGLAAERILLYADDYRHDIGDHYIDQALQGLGLSYTAYYDDPSGFESALSSGTWDLVIVDNYSFTLGPVWDDIDAHIAAGGKALITSWNLDTVSSEPLWARLGLQWVSDLFTPEPVFRWDAGHPLFTRPESVPDFTELTDFYNDDGDRVNASGSSQLVAGFTPAATIGQGALLVAAGRTAIVNTFMPVENTSDRDADGELDAIELFTNEITALTIPTWLSASVEAGTVPPGGSVDIQITFDAAELFGGDYEGRVVVSSNDPDETEVLVPAHLHVTGVEDIAVEPLSLDFGSVYLGYSTQRTFTVTNAGTDALTVSGTVLGLPDYGATPPAYVLQPRASTTVTVTFAPTVASGRNTQLTLSCSDPDEPLVVVDLVGTGLVPPQLSVNPAALTAAAAPGRQKTKTLQICNNGGSDLVFGTGLSANLSSATTTAAFPGLDAVPASKLVARHAARFVLGAPRAALARLDVSAAAVVEHVEMGKGEPDPRRGAPVLQDAGGPDVFGYRWIDSDDPSGPAFQWLDVRSTGTAVFASPVDDSNRGPFPLGFEFSYYGTTYTEFRVCSNGFISFTSPSAQFSNQPLPSTNAPENMLAAFWSDLFVDPANGNVYYHSDGIRLVVQFEHIWHLSGEGPYSFEIVLYPDGSIVYQYLAVGDGFPFNTVGFQNAARNDGLSIGFNTDYVHDNLAVRIATAPAWFSLSPDHGVVPAGQCLELTVTLDATELETGDHSGTIQVSSNDPADPALSVPVLFHVGQIQTAVADIDPNAFNPQAHGNWVTAHLELPLGYAPGDVVIETVTLNGTVPADTENYSTSDFNQNGIPDLSCKFDRAAVEAMLPEGEAVLLLVEGEVRDTTWFWGSESVRIIRPRLHSPNGGETLAAGSSFTVTWENPRDWQVSHADLYFTLDDGGSWSTLAAGVVGTSCPWSLPSTASQSARVRVFVYDAQGVLGYDTSDATFSIVAGPTDVAALDLPQVYALRQNVPNPFNPMTRIEFDLPEGAQVRLQVFDAKGRLVAQLLDQWLPAGRQQVTWRGADARGRQVPSGVYICEIQAGAFTGRKRMVMIK